MAPPNPSSRPGLQGSGGGSLLPADALYEILLRLTAAELCRLRAVCRPWRCLLSDPRFAAAHAARHREPPFVVAGYHTARRSDDVICDVMDLSGRVVKRVRAAADAAGGNEWVRSAHLEFICTSKGNIRSFRLHNLATGAVCALPEGLGFRLHNLATGAVCALPEGLAAEHAAHQPDACHIHAWADFGLVASTGVYKVLCVLDRLCNDHRGQLCEVFTVDDGSHAHRWRGTKAPPRTVRIGLWQSVVISGIVYFFASEFVSGQDAALDRVASFDLETGVEAKSQRTPKQPCGCSWLALTSIWYG